MGPKIFYTLIFNGNEVSIEKAKTKGNYFVKNGEFEQEKSFIDQFGGNLHQAFFEITKDGTEILKEVANG